MKAAIQYKSVYQRGYEAAIEDMNQWQQERRRRQQERQARRWYFLKQKALGAAMLLLTVATAWALEGDVTIGVFTVPVGLMLIFSKEMMIVNEYYFAMKDRGNNSTQSRKRGNE